jgi:hypothetical protein
MEFIMSPENQAAFKLKFQETFGASI